MANLITGEQFNISEGEGEWALCHDEHREQSYVVQHSTGAKMWIQPKFPHELYENEKGSMFVDVGTAESQNVVPLDTALAMKEDQCHHDGQCVHHVNICHDVC